MTLKKFFSPENLSKFTKNLHTKAQSFFELEQTTPTPRTTDFASIPPKQLALFLQQAIRSQKTATLTLALKDGTTETLSGKLDSIQNRFDAVTLKISDKQTRVVFTNVSLSKMPHFIIQSSSVNNKKPVVKMTGFLANVLA